MNVTKSGTPQPAIAFDALTVRYGRKIAVDALSFEVVPQTVYALLGRNGAGKTSAIRCLLGLRKANGGRTTLFGQDPWKKRAKLMAHVGFVPEQPDAPPDLTPKQLTRFCSQLYLTWNQESALARLERFNVPQDTAFKNLSRGQKTQTLLTLALGHSPDLLILDDPTLGLDAIAKKDLFDELIDYMSDRKATVFLTTHDLHSVEGLAQRIGVMRDAHLLLDEDTESLKARYRRLRYRCTATSKDWSELAGFTVVDRKDSSWGIDAIVSDFSEDGFARFSHHPSIASAERDTLSLEEIFRAVAGDNNGDQVR